jgi:prepilin-type N-terminal cleavage/methylation domain-containing protein
MIMRNNHGFTLVEILASIVILGLIATVFFQMFIFSQKTTTGNQEKLVAINVAQGVLERLNHSNFYNEITSPGSSPVIHYPMTYTKANCSGDDCDDKYTIKINNIDYEIEITVEEKLESEMNLHQVKVRILGEDKKPKSSVKGFVEIKPIL